MGGYPLAHARYDSDCFTEFCNVLVWVVIAACMLGVTIIIPANAAVVWYESTPRQRKVSEMDNIYFKVDEMTLPHRNPPQKQMVCSGDNCIHVPHARYWKKPNVGPIVDLPLPDGVTLGDYSIVCEGWNESDQIFYASGTCQLQFTLVGKPFTRKVNLMK